MNSLKPSAIARLWRATPDWLFRILGASIFLGYSLFRFQTYVGAWPHLGYFYLYDDGTRIDLPFVQVLIDLSLLTIALGYCVRVAPKTRAQGVSEVVVPFLAAFWPMYPFILHGLLRRLADVDLLSSIAQPAYATLDNLLGVGRMDLSTFAVGCGLIGLGNAVDIWGYITLRRSLSIVAEARELKVHGPYRFVRHPVYLGQFIAQAGVWLVLRRHLIVWGVYYGVFLALQLYRSRVEERVLEHAFGEDFRRWKSLFRFSTKPL